MTGYYVGNWDLLIRFDSYDRMRIFLENEPMFRRVYGYQSREYPQYGLVSDSIFRDEMVVDRRGYNVGWPDITYWGAYRGLKRYSSGGHPLTRG